MMRKERNREKDLEEERRIAKENWEVQQRQDARAAEDERRRMIKTNRRARVVEQQAKELERLTKKKNDEQEAAESATALATARRVKELKERQEQLIQDRHNEWMTLQREREAHRRLGPKKAFPARKQEVDAFLYDQEQRKREVYRLKEYQRAQIEERRKREKEEIENDIYEDNKMLAATQAKFNKSLQQLQTMIPKDLNITVPEYNITKTTNRLH